MAEALAGFANADIEISRIEPENFDAVVIQHQKQIYRILLGILHDADAADTLTQECFLRAFIKRDSFRGESSISTWLVRIAINLGRDYGRNRRWAFWHNLERTDRIDKIQVKDAGLSPEQAMINRESVNSIQSAVGSLTERQRMVFLLRFVEEMPLEEIAFATDMKLGTVKTHLFRAVEAVKAVCGRHEQKATGAKK